MYNQDLCRLGGFGRLYFTYPKGHVVPGLCLAVVRDALHLDTTMATTWRLPRLAFSA